MQLVDGSICEMDVKFSVVLEVAVTPQRLEMVVGDSYVNLCAATCARCVGVLVLRWKLCMEVCGMVIHLILTVLHSV